MRLAGWIKHGWFFYIDFVEILIWCPDNQVSYIDGRLQCSPRIPSSPRRSILMDFRAHDHDRHKTHGQRL